MSSEEARQFAEAKGMTYIETSAKNFENVSESFVECARIILKNIDNGQINPQDEVRIIST